MINAWFWLALVAGFVARMYSGRAISIAAGFIAGVILNEVYKYVFYYGREWLNK